MVIRSLLPLLPATCNKHINVLWTQTTPANPLKAVQIAGKVSNVDERVIDKQGTVHALGNDISMHLSACKAKGESLLKKNCTRALSGFKKGFCLRKRL